MIPEIETINKSKIKKDFKKLSNKAKELGFSNLLEAIDANQTEKLKEALK